MIRTKDQLFDKLGRELAWRKKELTDLKFIIDSSQIRHEKKNVLARCGVTILYAHWEGFIKNSTRAFLEYIASQRLLNKDLALNLLTISFRKTVLFAASSKKYSEFRKVTEFFTEQLERRSNLPYKDGISTESNLSSKVLKEIAWCLGIDYSLFETKEKFIDSILLARRNNIAHGEKLSVTLDDYNEIRKEVIELMTNFKTQIENIVLLERYKNLSTESGSQGS